MVCKRHVLPLTTLTQDKIVNESMLKSALMLILKQQNPRFVALRHEDIRTSGIPDLSLTGFNRTTWWEFKYANPKFKSEGIQELTMLRLAAVGFARYVVWEDVGGFKRTLVVHPKHIGEDLGVHAESSCVGFDHRFIAKYMEDIHRRGY